jgi:hypothetical protein
MTYSQKVNILVASLPTMFLLAILDLGEAAHTFRWLRVLFLGLSIMTVIGLAQSCYNDCDRLPADKRIVYRSLTVTILMTLQGMAMAFVPRDAPPRDSLPQQSGSFRGFDRERRRSVVVVEIDDKLMQFRAQDSFMSRLRQLEEGAPLEFRAIGHQITEVSSGGRRIGGYEEYAEEYGKMGWRGAALVGIAVAAYLWFTRGRASFVAACSRMEHT